MQLRLRGRDASEALLTVASDGAPIAPEVEHYLFEPFFSTRSRGAGLGLYICRELCERHGARISFQLRPASDRHRNEFSIALRRQAAGVNAAA
jgi:two-component system sensor histidine kinase PilS (NtrC family)